MSAKLFLNNEGVTILREYSDKLSTILDKLDDDIDQLMRVYDSVSETVGVHSDDFRDMLLLIKKAKDISRDSIIELSYQLNCTADKMEAYIGHGASYGSVNLGHMDIKQRYNGEVNNRLNSSETSETAKNLYVKYAEKIRIVDFDYTGTAFYNSVSNGIKLNAMADMHNPTGNMSTYFHEVGHMLDDHAGKGEKWLSSDDIFSKSLRNDVNAYINKIIIEKHCELDEAYDIISEELSGDWNAGISDIFGSLTNCQCQGEWGHHFTYWQEDSSRIEKEAFANMFEASIGSNKKMEEMKRYFPRAYARFEEIIRSNVDDTVNG